MISSHIEGSLSTVTSSGAEGGSKDGVQRGIILKFDHAFLVAVLALVEIHKSGWDEGLLLVAGVLAHVSRLVQDTLVPAGVFSRLLLVEANKLG